MRLDRLTVDIPPIPWTASLLVELIRYVANGVIRPRLRIITSSVLLRRSMD